MFHTDYSLSKSLSWLLRHGACEAGFEISPEGYLEVDKILKHPKYKGRCKLSDIVTIVETDEKQRYELRRNPTFGYLEIKANQGHSISSVCEGFKQILTPIYDTVVHGTYYRWWPHIRRNGLCRMQRNHIHFAKIKPVDGQVVSGVRRNADILIYINLAKALNDGLRFYESENGVILTAGNEQGYLKPEYFSKVVDAHTGMS